MRCVDALVCAVCPGVGKPVDASSSKDKKKKNKKKQASKSTQSVEEGGKEEL